MIMSDATRSKLLELIAELRSEKSRLERRLRDEIEKIDRDLKAVQRTLDLLTGTNEVEQASSQLKLSMMDVSIIANTRTQPEALKALAEQNQGIVNVTKAADFLIRAGRATGKRRNLVSSLYTSLRNDDEWEWASPGNFRLKRDQGKPGLLEKAVQ